MLNIDSKIKNYLEEIEDWPEGCTEPNKGEVFDLVLFDLFKRCAPEKFGKESSLYRYFRASMGQDKLVKPSELTIDNPQELAMQAEEFGTYIKENFSFNLFFQGMVNDRLCRQQYPQYAQKEDLIRQQYIKGEISLEAAIEQLKKELSDMGLLEVK